MWGVAGRADLGHSPPCKYLPHRRQMNEVAPKASPITDRAEIDQGLHAGLPAKMGFPRVHLCPDRPGPSVMLAVRGGAALSDWPWPPGTVVWRPQPALFSSPVSIELREA